MPNISLLADVATIGQFAIDVGIIALPVVGYLLIRSSRTSPGLQRKLDAIWRSRS